MRRKVLVILLMTLFMATATVSFGQESEEMESSMMGKEMKGSMMSGEGMMQKGKMTQQRKKMRMCRMHRMMMKTIMGKEMVSTKDGGIVLMVGNKLIKYDKDLNLKREVEIKMDTEGMQRHMTRMMEMMTKGGMMGEATKEPDVSKEESGHQAHH